MSNLNQLSPTEITLYGVSWCSDCRRAKRVFAELQANYVEIDIDADEKAAEFVKQVNRGNRSVPTILFPDGTSLTEPDNATLAAKIAQVQKTA
jgi:mycoredoxin